MADSRAIGVFDSGFGGLTVLSAMRQVMPHESMVYLGDTARVPYGTKSAQTVVNYALSNAAALLNHGPLKMLVVACNTVSSVALPALQAALSIPVVGVITPGAQAVFANKASSIAVLATTGTVTSNAYEISLREMGFAGTVVSKACPLFVPLVEEGMVTGDIAKAIAEHYLGDIPRTVDAIILGCTHYPLLLPTLQTVFNTPVQWIDSGKMTAHFVKKELRKQELLAGQFNVPNYHYLVSDAPDKFEQLSAFYFGEPVEKGNVELVDIKSSTEQVKI
jgi:glutamate racemase